MLKTAAFLRNELFFLDSRLRGNDPAGGDIEKFKKCWVVSLTQDSPLRWGKA
jgi:hypothetical protein